MSVAVFFTEPGVWVYVNAADVDTMPKAKVVAAALYEWTIEQDIIAIDGGKAPVGDAFVGTFKPADAERIAEWLVAHGVKRGGQ